MFLASTDIREFCESRTEQAQKQTSVASPELELYHLIQNLGEGLTLTRRDGWFVVSNNEIDKDKAVYGQSNVALVALKTAQKTWLEIEEKKQAVERKAAEDVLDHTRYNLAFNELEQKYPEFAALRKKKEAAEADKQRQSLIDAKKAGRV